MRTKMPTTIVAAPVVSAAQEVVRESIKEQQIIEITDVTQRIIILESEFRHLLEKLNSIQEKLNSIQETEKTDIAEINNLITKMQKIETDMEDIGEKISKLFEDKEKKEADINVRAFNNNIRLIKIFLIFFALNNIQI